MDLLPGGVAAGLLLGIDQLPVHGYLEDTAGGLHQPDLGVRKGLTNLRLQTGGARFVVSDYAVFNADVHGSSLRARVYKG